MRTKVALCIAIGILSALFLPGCSRSQYGSRAVIMLEVPTPAGERQAFEVAISSRLEQSDLDKLLAARREMLAATLSELEATTLNDDEFLKLASRQLSRVLQPEGRLVRLVEVTVAAKLPPEPKVLEELRRLPGTLGYVDQN